MANEFIIKNGFRSQGNSEVTGSLNVTGGITGSLLGTASFATTAGNATSISSAITNDIDNRVLTATGTGTINGETNLLFNGSVLTLAGPLSQSLGGSANGTFSHAQGMDVFSFGDYSHAEGSGSATSTSTLYTTNAVTAGVIVMNTDLTTVFEAGDRLYYNSNSYPDNTIFIVSSSIWNGSTTTITLTDTSITDIKPVFGSLDYPYSSWAGGASSTAIAGHAEGFYTNAIADFSHAEGRNTQTFGQWSHAEGYQSQAIGTFSHAEGRITKTFGKYSHTEGENTQTKGDGSHAEGYSTIASGSYSHAEGQSTTANGTYSHAEGGSSNAYGAYSHAEGNGQAYGTYSHAEGESTETGNPKGYYAVMTANGVFTISSSYGDLSGLGLFDAGNLIGVDDSQYDNINTYTNLTAASCSFNGTNTLVHVTDTSFLTSTASIGGITNFASNAGDQYWGGYAAHAQGYATIAQGAYSHAEGIGQAYGAYSHAEGGGQAYGAYSHAEGGGNAYGTYSHAEGNGTTYGTYSHAEGVSTTAGWRGYAVTAPIAAGVIKLLPVYGDRTTDFQAGSFVLIQDTLGEIVAGVTNTYRYEISGSAFTSSLTQITLYDTSVTTATNKPIIGVYGNSNPTSADAECGQGSHAEGYATTAYGDYSHAAGFGTQTVGWYQSVVGQGNIPLSSTSSFIVGNGSYDVNNDIWTRSNLLVAEGNTVQISGSLQVSGSLTISPTSSGTPAYTGKDGQIVFGQTGADYKIYVWLGGAWRSGSLS